MMWNVSGIKFSAVTLALVVAALAGMSQSASAVLITEQVVDKGWYSSEGNHDNANTNYFVGDGASGTYYNNWAVFDLTGVTDTILDATLSIYNSDPRGAITRDASETYAMFDVNTPIANLVAGGTGLTNIYNDLGTGVMLGSTQVTNADGRAYVNITFNAAGIAYLNDHRGQLVALGGSITTLDTSSSTGEYTFSGSLGNSNSHLLEFNTDAVAGPTNAVPEPATAALGMMTLVGLAAASRRRK